jgi:predicted dehydrogenase
MGVLPRPGLRERMGPNWFPLSHADAVLEVPEMSLVACCDVDAGLAAAAKKSHGFELVYTDYQKMLREAELDILCVATRGDVRPDILCAAADAGIKAVHCEKPLAHSLALGEKAVAALERAKIAFSYGTLRTYMPVYRNALTSIENGAIGTLQSVSVKFGRSALLWTHPHSVSLLAMFERSPVEYIQANLHLDSAVENRMLDTDPIVLSATVAFASGVTAHIVDQGGLTLDLAGTDGFISVVGDGAWTVHGNHATGTECDPPGKWNFRPDTTQVSGRTFAMQELRDALIHGKQTSLSPRDALYEQRLLFGFVQSHLEGGRRIAVDDIDPDLIVTGRTNGRVA